MSNDKTLTITLTGRRPVTITTNDWPVLASSEWSDHDNQYECQANRRWKTWIKVRQHIDGRTIVYGGYSYSTQFQDESDASYRDGVMLTPTDEEYPTSMRDEDHDWTGDRIVEAIGTVGRRLGERSECEHFADLIAECIADLPSEQLT